MGGGSLDDYKFLCFAGKVACFWIDKDRATNHKRGFWGRDLNYLEVEHFHPMLDRDTKLPNNIEEMIRVAEIIASDFPHARIDLYIIEGSIIFGKITFYSSSGYCIFTPQSFDYTLGSYFNEYS